MAKKKTANKTLHAAYKTQTFAKESFWGFAGSSAKESFVGGAANHEKRCGMVWYGTTTIVFQVRVASTLIVITLQCLQP